MRAATRRAVRRGRGHRRRRASRSSGREPHVQVRRRPELPAAQHGRALGVEPHVGQPLEEQAQRDRLQLTRERVARAEVPAEAERRVLLARSVDVEAIGVGVALLVAVRRGDHERDRLARRDRRAADLDVLGGRAQLGPDRRDQPQPLLDGVRHEPCGIGRDLGGLRGIGEQRREGRARPVPRLLHAAEQDHEQARQHELARARIAVRPARVQHVRDRRVVGLALEAVEQRREARADLGRDGVADRLLRRDRTRSWSRPGRARRTSAAACRRRRRRARAPARGRAR